MEKQCLVKFTNNKTYWYTGDCELGDVVFCTGSQENLLGRVIQTSTTMFAMQRIKKKVGHIDPENRDDLINLYLECTEKDRECIFKYLDIKEPYYQDKFINALSNHWTVKGLEGMTWDEYLSYIRTVQPIPSYALPLPRKKNIASFNGYIWGEIDPLPEIEPISCGELFHGVVYGTEKMIRTVQKDFMLEEVREVKNGIYRGKIRKNDEKKIMELFPECKTAFFCYQKGSFCAVFSESGYSYITGRNKKNLPVSHSEYQYIYKYYPDEMFREIAPFYSIGAPVVYDGLDNFLQSLDYVIQKDGQFYQMTDIDHWDPPVDMNRQWIWHCEEDKAIIDRYTSFEKHVVFPKIIEGHQVIGIADRIGGSDSSYKYITSIEIPEGYCYIGAYAFADCSSLTEVSLPVTLESIKDGAFLKCKKLKKVILPKRMNQFYRDDNSKNGGSFVFYGCNALKEAYYRSPGFIYDYDDTRAFPVNTLLKHMKD